MSYNVPQISSKKSQNVSKCQNVKISKFMEQTLKMSINKIEFYAASKSSNSTKNHQGGWSSLSWKRNVILRLHMSALRSALKRSRIRCAFKLSCSLSLGCIPAVAFPTRARSLVPWLMWSPDPKQFTWTAERAYISQATQEKAPTSAKLLRDDKRSVIIFNY
jgi:hypothetical protein